MAGSKTEAPVAEEQAKEAFIEAVKDKGGLDSIGDAYMNDPSPSLDRTIRCAESFGATVRLVVEFPEL